MSPNSTKTFPAFQLNNFENANSFVKCWGFLYNYPRYEIYKSAVIKKEFSDEDIRTLFEWKNGMNLSAKKEQSFLKKILQHKELINELKRDFVVERFDDSFGKMSAVWQIFLLHTIKPADWPIFDQHVYRAFMFIENRVGKSLPFTQTAKLKIFHGQYYPFFLNMVKLADEHDHFEIDKALWTFGKMIKEYPEIVKIRA